MPIANTLNAVVINASPNPGTTLELSSKVAHLLASRGFGVRVIDVYKLSIQECIGCFSIAPDRCTYPCVVSDDMGIVYRELLASHAAVFVTPTYWANVPGKLKNLVDRLTALENNGFQLEGIVAAVIAVNQVSGGWEAASWLAGVLNMMGALIPPYGIQVFYSRSIAERLEHSAGEAAKEFWGDTDLTVLADNVAHLCSLRLRDHCFGFRKNSTPNTAV
ncbi:MAG: flavodoxin family protein [Thermoprotei archaeon]